MVVNATTLLTFETAENRKSHTGWWEVKVERWSRAAVVKHGGMKTEPLICWWISVSCALHLLQTVKSSANKNGSYLNEV